MRRLGGMPGAAAMAVACAVALLTPATAEVIGEAVGPFSSGGIRLVEPRASGAVNYRRTTATVRGIASCSGMVTRFVLTRHISDDLHHEIAMIYHTKGEALCMHIALLKGTHSDQGYSGTPEFFECTTPVADPHARDANITIEWGRERTRFLVNDVAVGVYSKPFGQPNDPYYQLHETYLAIHHSNNATMDGLSTPTCEEEKMLLTGFRVVPYDTDFDEAAAYAVPVKADAAVTSWDAWSGSSKWQRLNRIYSQTEEEFLLQKNVEVSRNGITITSTLVNPLGRTRTPLFANSNGLFQATTVNNSLSDPYPWVIATDKSPLVSWKYDPYDEEAQGAMIFDILSTGQHPESIMLSQVFQENLPASLPHEYCAYVKISSTFNRTIQVSLFPEGQDTDAAAATYMGRWNLTLVGGITKVHNRCFTAPTNAASVRLAMKVILGGLEKPIFLEHIIKIWSIGVYALEAAATGAQWLEYNELILDPGLNNIGRWRNDINRTEVDYTFAADVLWDFKLQTAAPEDVRMSNRDGLLLTEGLHYRVRVRAGSADERFIKVAIDNGATGNDTALMGGQRMMQLYPDKRYSQYTFKAEETTRNVNTGVGLATLTVFGGGPEYGAATGAVEIVRINMEQWDTDLPELPELPAKPAIGPRTTRFIETTNVPFTATPVVIVEPTGIPATPRPVTSPDELKDLKNLPDLYAYLYQSSQFLMVFNDTQVEDTDIAEFKSDMKNIMIEICLVLGYATRTDNCALETYNVQIVEHCYQNTADLYFDPRACRGIGEKIRFSYAQTREVNTTGIESYMVFTFVGLPRVLAEDTAFEARVVSTLNERIELGQISIRPTVEGAVKIIRGPPITDAPPPSTTRTGMKDWVWAVLLALCVICAFMCGFSCWYQQRLVALKRQKATKELFQKNTEPDYVPTILSGMGMLTLSDLGLLKRQFDLMDADGGGTLDRKEIRDVLSKVVEFTEEEFVRFFTTIDEDGNEEIEFREFATGFVPYLVSGTVGVHAGDGQNIAEEADYLFGALQGEHQMSSLFELKQNITDEESRQQLKEMTVMERLAAKSMISVSRRAEAVDGDVVVAPVTTLLDVDTEVMVTEDPERRAQAMEKMGDVYCDPEENPEMVMPNMDELAGLRGTVVEVWEDEEEEKPEDDDELYDRDRDSEADFGFAYRVSFPTIGSEYWVHRTALDHKPVDFIHGWITKQKRRDASSRERLAILMAVLAGLVSSGVVAAVEYVAEEQFTTNSSADPSFDLGLTGKESAFYAIVFPITIAVTILEIMFLYYNVTKATVKVAKIFGVVLYPLDEQRSFLVAALSRTAFELGHSVKTAWAIDPAKELTDWQRFLADLAYRAKTGVGAFVFRLMFKRVITRVGAKAASSYVACPFVMFMNFLVAKLVLNKARDVGLGPRLITKMLENLERSLEPGATPWQLGSQWVTVAHFEKLSVNILRAIGCVVVARGEWHPCLEYLFRETRIRLGMKDVGGVRDVEAEEEARKEREERGEIDSEDEEALFEEMRNIERIKLDIEPLVDVDVFEKLIIALRLDAESAFYRQTDAQESASESENDDEGYDWAFSDYSSRSDPPPPICFDQNEKTLILKFMVLAIIVSGPMSSKIDKMVQRAFSAAGGDITTRPHRTIEALYNMFHDGNLREVCRSFDLVFRTHRTMKGDDRRFWDDLAMAIVDW